MRTISTRSLTSLIFSGKAFSLIPTQEESPGSSKKTASPEDSSCVGMRETRLVGIAYKFNQVLFPTLGLFLFLLINFAALAQSDNVWTGKKAEQWYAKMDWLNGLPAKPAGPINKEEFARQYNGNKAAWDKAFAFLKNTDFTRLRPGKYPIDDETVYATISEGPPREISNSKFEAHLNYSDIHYVVKGKEQIGIIPVESVKSNVAQEYSADKDIGFYTTDAGKFYVAEPGLFYIVTPKEAHNPSNKVDGYDGVKKVVVKVRNIP